jgi:hypothetical protein
MHEANRIREVSLFLPLMAVFHCAEVEQIWSRENNRLGHEEGRKGDCKLTSLLS